MFNQKEASRIRQEFWTTFGKYMSPILSSEGMKINWINYHTRLKDVYFRMEADSKSAVIAISLEHNDRDIRQIYYEQFLEFSTMLRAVMEEEWEWNQNVLIDNKEVSRISKTLSGATVFNRDHWPALISFFKARIIALDSFWENAKYSFEILK